MKKITLILAIALFASCQKDKVGYVDNVKLIDGFKDKQAVDKKYEAKQAQFAKKSDSIGQIYQAEAERLQAELARLSERQRNEKIGEYTQRRDFVTRQLEQELQLIQAQGQEEMDTLIQKVRKTIKKYGEDNGYTYILSGGEGGSVLYGAEVNNLTEELLKVLNKEE